MTRDGITSSGITELSEGNIMVLPIVYLDTGGAREESVYVWGGVDDLVWDGDTYQGVGSLGKVEAVKSDAKGTLNSLQLGLTGLPEGLVMDIRELSYAGKSGKVWVGLFDADLNQIGDPVLMFAGEISTMTLSDGPGEQQISVELESRMSILRRVMPAFRSDEDHQRRHHGDKFFSFVPSVINKTVYWGMKIPTPTGARGIGGGGGFRTPSDSWHFKEY